MISACGVLGRHPRGAGARDVVAGDHCAGRHVHGDRPRRQDLVVQRSRELGPAGQHVDGREVQRGLGGPGVLRAGRDQRGLGLLEPSGPNDAKMMGKASWWGSVRLNADRGNKAVRFAASVCPDA